MYRILILLCIVSSSFVSAKARGPLQLPPGPRRNIVCYFASWTVYRLGKGAFDVGDIDPTLCTHINFAFVGLNADSSIHVLDPWESSDPSGINGFRNLVALRKTNPNLKILLSMGGWNEGSTVYSFVASDPGRRRTLARNVLRFIQEWDFDGFDLDWEYPGLRDGNPRIDKNDFTELLRDLAAELRPSGYLLTAAVAGKIEIIDISYDAPAINDILDMINVMVYDFQEDGELVVRHSSPLYPSSQDIQHDDAEKHNVKAGIEYWLSHGAAPEKVNLGVVTYGRSFTLADERNNSLYAPTLGPGMAGPYTAQIGILGYNEICEYHLRTNYHWDDEQMVPHRVWHDQWVGFEDKRSIQLKAQFAVDHDLGGMMVWSFDTDDFRGTCGEKYPLLNAVKNVLTEAMKKKS